MSEYHEQLSSTERRWMYATIVAYTVAVIAVFTVNLIIIQGIIGFIAVWAFGRWRYARGRTDEAHTVLTMLAVRHELDDSDL